ncbi:PfkB family carbohydrate kinase [Roseiterribacter gracilis]|uniref:Bifunctional protein HldE n=1 Tax=Roseiterribacter gracilis TaxID=2812848 RepID=A0A8S8XHJ9_9PROT|nr:bifunctional protein HldE [Rhodospirillales bacterium TMPK1]
MPATNVTSLHLPADKIRTLDQLSAVLEGERRAGRKIALAHGVFDLVHLGHVRHLQEARSLADILVVTLTNDPFVNKGPGRPVFTAALRAEMLANLAHVSFVAINDAPTAEPVLRAVRPDFYVKGPDYADESADITGGIVTERRLVESLGGRIVFTDDITFSSSSLINQHLGVYDSELQAYLETQRKGGTLDAILKQIDLLQNRTALLVGDAIIDEYQYVNPMAKAPKENMIATLFQGREVFAGGVIAAANHVAAFCKQVRVITCLGDDDPYEDVVRAAAKPNVDVEIIRVPGRPTTRKCRFVESGYMRKLFEVYHMDDSPPPPAVNAALVAALHKHAGAYDCVIATDFGHGMLTTEVRDELQKSSKFLAVNTQTNSANFGFNLVSKYSRADYVCIDAPEARLATGDKNGPIEDVISIKLPDLVKCRHMVVTHGKNGCLTYDADSGLHRIPAFTKQVVDTVGAGDAFLAATSPLVAIGCPMPLVGFVGNAAGAIKVGIVGHRRSIEKPALVKFITALLK